MEARDRSSSKRTHREEPTAGHLLVAILPAVTTTAVVTDAGSDALRQEVLSWVAVAVIAVAAGLITRRSLAATQLTTTGVRVRGTASAWRPFTWEAIDGVTVRPGSSSDGVMRMRDRTEVVLRGLPLAHAEQLAERLAQQRAEPGGRLGGR